MVCVCERALVQACVRVRVRVRCHLIYSGREWANQTGSHTRANGKHRVVTRTTIWTIFRLFLLTAILRFSTAPPPATYTHRCTPSIVAKKLKTKKSVD